MSSAAVEPKLALFLPSLEGGGAERVFVQLANEFAASGLRVDLVLASAQGPYLRDVSTRVRIVDLESPRLLRALLKLRRYLRAERPATMLSGLDHANVAAIAACRFAASGTRCVISIRSVPTEVYRRAETRRGELLVPLMRISYRFADAIVANSRAVALDLSRLLRVPLDDIHVIYNPLNLARIAAQGQQPPDHVWMTEGAPAVVLGVGSLTPLKDFATLIRAFAIFRSRRECRLVILGEGPERARLESLAREAGIAADVYMPGFVENPFAWMRAASVIVSSSLTEGCPNALMQALALDTPIVSTNCVGGSAELLENGRWGRLVPVGQPGAMAAAIGECFADSRRPETHRRADAFSHERIAEEYLEVLLPGRLVPASQL